METDVSCPQARRTATNRSMLSAIWASDEWKAFVKFHTERVGECEKCHKKEGDIAVNNDGEEYVVHLTVDHPFRWAYKSRELYLDYDSSMCRVVCRTCNSAFERHVDICPVCLKHYKSDTQPMCNECYFAQHPAAKALYSQGKQDQKRRQAARNQKKRRALHPHSCDRRGLGQKCKYRPGMVCDQNTRNAPKNKCGHFKARKI